MSIPYLQRAFRIVINLKNGDQMTVADSDNSLQCVFSISGTLEFCSYCNLSIYNLSASSQQIAASGDSVEIYAGYEFNNGSQNLIFKGRILQPMLEKENVTDIKLTLRCYIYMLEDRGTHVDLTIAAGGTALDAVQQIAKAGGLVANNIETAVLSKIKYPRATPFSGRPTRLIAEIAKDTPLYGTGNGCWLWFDSFGVNIRIVAKKAGVAPDIMYCPPGNGINVLPASKRAAKPILIGSARQTQQGVEFTVLLDDAVRIGKQVELVNTFIVQAERSADPRAKLFPPLSVDGTYVVFGFEHIGNTRTGRWETEVIAATDPLGAWINR